ncbi:hypothetical protein ACSST1_22445 [Pantoea agglomerans]|uniref:hypothetical protein n=1 Tax=Pantoea TaxID=53335 RepID=UPI00068CED9A|nr:MULTISPECIES: hypothetical protein [Pantoea]KOA71277.1 hypothetical protein AFL22_06795 [Pantoea sp. CFSAN033090]
MLYFGPEVSSSGITHWPRSRLAITPVLREGIPEPVREVCAERACFIPSLPLRYSGLPVRRRLIRTMLTLQKYGEARSIPDGPGQDAVTPAADYARSVIDTAMLRGELRCRPSGEMADAYLKLAEELRSKMAGLQQDKALLRTEVRRRTADFLRRYAAGSGA